MGTLIHDVAKKWTYHCRVSPTVKCQRLRVHSKASKSLSLILRRSTLAASAKASIEAVRTNFFADDVMLQWVEIYVDDGPNESQKPEGVLPLGSEASLDKVKYVSDWRYYLLADPG
jgi:hypothetical protein